MATTKTERNKLPALITYIIAVAVVIAGLILPLESATISSGIDFGKMPLLQLGGAVAAVMGQDAAAFGSPLDNAFSINANVGGVSVNIGAYLLLALIAFTAVAVILLIPACIVKKDNPSAKKLIVTGELLMATPLYAYTFLTLAKLGGNINLSVTVPFLVVLVMLFVQSIYYHGSSGVMKTVLAIISGLAVFALMCVSAPALIDMLNGLCANMKGNAPFDTTYALFSADGPVSGIGAIYLFAASITAFAFDGGYFTLMFAAVLSVLAVLNFYLDMLGLGKKTNKFMLVANLIRYIAQIVFALVLCILVFVVKGSFGLTLYLLIFLSIVQVIIQIARFSHYRKTASVGVAVVDDKDAVDFDVDDADSDKAAETAASSAETAALPAPYAGTEAPVTDTRNVVYNVNTIYNGPMDGFIRKLTNEQKVEFAKVFLERANGNLAYIPDYIVGGDNTRFFSAVFIYFARVRDLVSDGLMSKMYEEKGIF